VIDCRGKPALLTELQQLSCILCYRACAVRSRSFAVETLTGRLGCFVPLADMAQHTPSPSCEFGLSMPDFPGDALSFELRVRAHIRCVCRKSRQTTAGINPHARSIGTYICILT
jgi:hypothetical protein